MKKLMLFALSALAAGPAYAQGEERSHPAAADVPVAPVVFRSALEGYRPWQEQALASWKEINEAVARIGGHMGVLRAGKEPEAAKRADHGRPHEHGERR